MRSMKTLRHIQAAERAYAKGSCLRAGQEIDRAYVGLGRRPSRALRARLERLDSRFERHCVRKHPQ